MEDLASVEKRASHVKLLLMDCDGVLTDGRLCLLEHDEQKTFDIKDGLGLVLLQEAGLKAGIISGRASRVLDRRASELGIQLVRQGHPDKLQSFEELLSEACVDSGEVAFIGDDLTDVLLLQRVELAVAVADAAPEARMMAHYVTEARGGRGAVREVVELLLKAQGRWSAVTRRYLKH